MPDTIYIQKQLDHVRDLYNKGYKVKAVEINERSGKLFFILKDEPLESVVKKFFDLYPDEARWVIEDLNDQKSAMVSPNGMSRGKMVRLAARIPVPLYNIIKQLYPSYLEKDHLRKLKQLIPAFCV